MFTIIVLAVITVVMAFEIIQLQNRVRRLEIAAVINDHTTVPTSTPMDSRSYDLLLERWLAKDSPSRVDTGHLFADDDPYDWAKDPVLARAFATDRP